MRHNKKKGLKLGTDTSHTKAMKKSLAKALFENDRIKTTETRAKALRSVVEPIITWAKKGDLHSRRLSSRTTASRPPRPVLRRCAALSSPSSPGPRRATCTLVVSLSPSWAIRTSWPRSSIRPLRACGPTATAVTPAS